MSSRNVGNSLDDFRVKTLGWDTEGYKGDGKGRGNQRNSDSRMDKIRDEGEAWEQTIPGRTLQASRREVSVDLSAISNCETKSLNSLSSTRVLR